jgi:predicted CXXCH cytochrome family protein
VGCLSCHNTFSKVPNQLVMSNQGSALCLACHMK